MGTVCTSESQNATRDCNTCCRFGILHAAHPLTCRYLGTWRSGQPPGQPAAPSYQGGDPGADDGGRARASSSRRDWACGAGDLTFKRVFERVEATTGERLTNASVIRRVWENQAEFQTDVLASVAASGDTNGELATTMEAVAPLFEVLDRSSPEARLRAVSEVCRAAGRRGVPGHGGLACLVAVGRGLGAQCHEFADRAWRAAPPRPGGRLRGRHPAAGVSCTAGWPTTWVYDSGSPSPCGSSPWRSVPWSRDVRSARSAPTT